MAHVVEGHRPAPAEQIVRDEEGVEDEDRDVGDEDVGDGQHLAEEFIERHRAGRRQSRLDEVVERPVPVVQPGADLDVKVDDLDDGHAANNRPPEPAAVAAVKVPWHAEQVPGHDDVLVQPDLVRREERLRVGFRRLDTEHRTQADHALQRRANGEPGDHADGNPEQGGREVDLGVGKEGLEHGALLAGRGRSRHLTDALPDRQGS